VIRRVLSVELGVTSPFLFAGESNAMLGVDGAALRDHAGRPLVPAEQVRGVLRAAMETLKRHATAVADGDLVKRLFGDESPKNEGRDPSDYDKPERGTLLFGNLVADTDERVPILTRVAIDDETGAAAEGQLQLIELVAKPGATVTFTGKAVLFADNEAVADRSERALSRAAALVPAIGSTKSAGFGEVTAFAVRRDPATADKLLTLPNLIGAPENEGRVALVVTSDRPLLVDAARVTENLFAGAEVIPGTAVKGALAERIRRAGGDPESGAGLGLALSRLRVSHALPENGSGHVAGLFVPNSVCAIKGPQGWIFGDALSGDPARIPMMEGRTPHFPVDWKPEAFGEFAAKGLFPASAGIPLDPRMHVKIGKEGVAEDAKLFATLRRRHMRGDAPQRWRLVIDTGGIEDAGHARQLVQLLLQGLDNVGRTGATLSFERAEDNADDPRNRLRSSAPPGAEGRTFNVSLITPGLLVDAGAIARRGDRRVRVADHAAYWNALGFALEACFQGVKLAGGYVATRRRPYGSSYYPFVLTEAGSVFRVTGDAKRMAGLLRHGLPAASQTGAATLGWRNCPYLPENGYGEIALDLVDHAGLGKAVAHV
jgi:CRISPR/Cas system CSM-associated protein Csm3 (group 7 of RAMP superfamily)